MLGFAMLAVVSVHGWCLTWYAASSSLKSGSTDLLEAEDCS